MAVKRFKEANVNLMTLSNYSALITAALETGFIRESDVATLKEWRKDPSLWTPDSPRSMNKSPLTTVAPPKRPDRPSIMIEKS